MIDYSIFIQFLLKNKLIFINTRHSIFIYLFLIMFTTLINVTYKTTIYKHFIYKEKLQYVYCRKAYK